jgi:hypothetical protein
MELRTASTHDFPSPLYTSKREPPDELALDEEDHDDDRQSHKGGCRVDAAQVQVVECDEAIDHDRKGLRLHPRQNEGEEETVPGEDEGQDCSRDETRPDEGEGDAKENANPRAAIDTGRVF